MTRVSMVVNGRVSDLDVPDDERLLDTLRNRIGISGVREGCGVGECGACTAMVDGHTVSSCLMRTIRCDGRVITTANGLPEDDRVVRAFVDAGAMQCGYCIPGFVMMTQELLSENRRPTSAEIAAHLEGNICRCGSYREISVAVEQLAHLNAQLEGM